MSRIDELLEKAAEQIKSLIEENKMLREKLAQQGDIPVQQPGQPPQVNQVQQIIDEIIQLMLAKGLITADQVAAKKAELSAMPIEQLQQLRAGLVQQSQNNVPAQTPQATPPAGGGVENPAVGKVASIETAGRNTDDDLFQTLLELS